MSKKSEPHEEHADESWLIPYADLLTLLLALFIVLFASSQVDAKKFNEMKAAFVTVFMGEAGAGVIGDGSGTGDGSNGASPGSNQMSPAATAATVDTAPQETTIGQGSGDGIPLDPRMTELRAKFDQYIQDHQLSSQLKTQTTPEMVMIIINDVVLFDSGSASIKSAFYPVIDSITDILAENPGLEVQILGHTDNVPISNSIFETNWDLSSARALSFMKYLLKDTRLDPTHYSAIGYGEYRPIAVNDTEAGKAANRRVEITARFID